jgi:hypothetical protein
MPILKMVMMRIKFAMNMLFLLLILITACGADSPDRFQSVSGEFAKNWITSFKAQNPAPIQKSEENGSDLWSWGMAPKGSKIENGKLITDPYYLRPLLNYSSNWLGETYTDAATGLPIETYVDPLTGKTIIVYLNPNTGKAIFTYSTYLDPNTGKSVYSYVDPMTGNQVNSSVKPIDIVNALTGRLTGQTVSNQNEPWTRI